MYVFVRLGIGVHMTSHVFYLSAGLNVFWGNKTIKSILNQYSGKGKQFFNTQYFSKETKLYLFSVTKYTEMCFVGETVSSFLLQVWKNFLRLNTLCLGLWLFQILVIVELCTMFSVIVPVYQNADDKIAGKYNFV